MGVQAWGGVFPGSPPLDPARYARCFGMRLDGYLAPQPPPDIAWDSATRDAATAAHTRVCIRYSDHAAVTLGGVQLACAPPGNFDATLECHDLAALPGGMVPLSVQYGSDPRDADNVLQMWVIPVSRAWQVGALDREEGLGLKTRQPTKKKKKKKSLRPGLLSRSVRVNRPLACPAVVGLITLRKTPVSHY